MKIPPYEALVAPEHFPEHIVRKFPGTLSDPDRRLTRLTLASKSLSLPEKAAIFSRLQSNTLSPFQRDALIDTFEIENEDFERLWSSPKEVAAILLLCAHNSIYVPVLLASLYTLPRLQPPVDVFLEIQRIVASAAARGLEQVWLPRLPPKHKDYAALQVARHIVFPALLVDGEDEDREAILLRDEWVRAARPHECHVPNIELSWI